MQPVTASPRYSKYYGRFITNQPGTTFCGEYEQLTSQFPGAGPCYAVWAQTYPWFYRCVICFRSGHWHTPVDTFRALFGCLASSGLLHILLPVACMVYMVSCVPADLQKALRGPANISTIDAETTSLFYSSYSTLTVIMHSCVPAIPHYLQSALWCRSRLASVPKPPTSSLLPQPNMPHVCRCVPALPDDLQKALYGAAASYISSTSTKLTSLSSSLNTNSQRLRRYISDINRGRWLIIAAGEPLSACIACPDILQETGQLCIVQQHYGTGSWLLLDHVRIPYGWYRL